MVNHEKPCDYWLIINVQHSWYNLKVFLLNTATAEDLSYCRNFTVLSSFFEVNKQIPTKISKSATNLVLALNFSGTQSYFSLEREKSKSKLQSIRPLILLDHTFFQTNTNTEPNKKNWTFWLRKPNVFRKANNFWTIFGGKIESKPK